MKQRIEEEEKAKGNEIPRVSVFAHKFGHHILIQAWKVTYVDVERAFFSVCCFVCVAHLLLDVTCYFHSTI